MMDCSCVTYSSQFFSHSLSHEYIEELAHAVEVVEVTVSLISPAYTVTWWST